MVRKLLVATLALVLAALGAPGSVDAAETDYVHAIARYSEAQVQTTTIPAAAAMTLGEQATGIGPGSHLLMTMDADPGSIYGCTANYIWQSGTKLYLGAAGHCFLPETKVATDGVAADYDPSGTHVQVCVADCQFGGETGFLITGEVVDLGPVAYARQASSAAADAEDIGYDFGVVEIPSSLAGLVRYTMPVFGGPVRTDGTLQAGDITCHYGNGVAVGEVFPTMGRIGTGLFEDGGAWFAATPSAPGDSGSAFQTCRATDGGFVGDAAIGALTHISTLGIAGTTVEQAITLAREAGLSLTLKLAA